MSLHGNPEALSRPPNGLVSSQSGCYGCPDLLAYMPMPGRALTKVIQFLQTLSTRGAGGRGSAVTPIQWVIGLLIAGLANSSLYRAPEWWLPAFFATLLVGMLLFFCIIYCIWMNKDPDSLRSELYSLRKREIDQGLLGDAQTGLIRPRRARGRSGTEAPQPADPQTP